MEINLEPTEVLDLYKMSVGSQTFVINSVRKVMADKALKNARLERLLDEAGAALKVASNHNFLWMNRKNLPDRLRSLAFELDNKIDATLGMIHRLILTHVGAYGESEPKRMATELKEDLMPQGVRPLTMLRYLEQWGLTSVLLERLRGDYAEHVRVVGLTPFVDDLERFNDEFEEALAGHRAQKLEFADVKKARFAAEDAVAKVIFVIYGDYIEDDETRTALLKGLRFQQELIRRAMKRRRTAPEVDPETGLPVGEDAEGVE